MKTLFSELYNKLIELFKTEKPENTGECAANRLQVILMHDRTKLDPLIMGKMREELIEVFSKYVVIDKEKLEIDLTNEGNAAALMLNIPIIRSKTEEELEEIRKALQEQEKKIIENDDAKEEISEEINDKITENSTSDEEKDVNQDMDKTEEDTVNSDNSQNNSQGE